MAGISLKSLSPLQKFVKDIAERWYGLNILVIVLRVWAVGFEYDEYSGVEEVIQ